jgi:hypothetical protein
MNPLETMEPRLREKIQKELKEPARLWYLSFADESGWKGACIVPAAGILTAVLVCNRLGINPGGEVLAIPVPDHVAPLLPRETVGRLLTIKDMDRYFDGVVNFDANS